MRDSHWSGSLDIVRINRCPGRQKEDGALHAFPAPAWGC
jgi:hypothetical protein